MGRNPRRRSFSPPTKSYFHKILLVYPLEEPITVSFYFIVPCFHIFFVPPLLFFLMLFLTPPLFFSSWVSLTRFPYFIPLRLKHLGGRQARPFLPTACRFSLRSPQESLPRHGTPHSHRRGKTEVEASAPTRYSFFQAFPLSLRVPTLRLSYIYFFPPSNHFSSIHLSQPSGITETSKQIWKIFIYKKGKCRFYYRYKLDVSLFLFAIPVYLLRRVLLKVYSIPLQAFAVYLRS